MTPQQRFRFGFLSRCAEERLTMDEVRARVKFAHDRLQEKTALDGSSLANALKGALNFTAAPWIYSTGIGGAGALLGGAGLGYGAAKLQEQSVDPEDAKRQELVAVYKRYADQARMKAQNRSYRQPKPSNPQLF